MCGRDKPVHGVGGQNRDELITAQMQAGHGVAACRRRRGDFDRIMSAAILLNWATGKKKTGACPGLLLISPAVAAAGWPCPGFPLRWRGASGTRRCQRPGRVVAEIADSGGRDDRAEKRQTQSQECQAGDTGHVFSLLNDGTESGKAESPHWDRPKAELPQAPREKNRRVNHWNHFFGSADAN